MNICIVTTFVKKGDGQGRANYEVVKEALRRGYTVSIVAREVAEELQDKVEWYQIDVAKWPSELLKEAAFSREATKWVKSNRSRFDIVQVYGAICQAPSTFNTLQYVHDGWLKSVAHPSKVRSDMMGKYQLMYSKTNAKLEKDALSKAERYIAVSEQIKDEVCAIGFPAERIEVILNGVDPSEFYPGVGDRKSLGLPTAGVLGAFVGDIRSNRKNLDSVLKAMVDVPHFQLAVCGSLEGSPYPALAEELGIADRTHFLGFRRDVADILRGCDLFVFPSRYEACTLALLEAMGTGLPVITARATGGSEIVSSEAGFVLEDTEDIAALTKALRTLVEDESLRRSMGERALEISKMHSWKSKAEEYINLFEAHLAPATV